MKNDFDVNIVKFSNLTEIKNFWTSDDFRSLLEDLEYDDHSGLSDEELREVCIMSLQDLKPSEAAYAVLKYKMSDALREGQLRNLSVEMLDEKLWEEYPDMARHELFFNIGSLLYSAFPNYFPKPDAVAIQFEVTARNESSKKLLLTSPHESFLVRLVADGMDQHALLNRMFGEQLKGHSFSEADNIVWITNSKSIVDGIRSIEIISSGYWLDPIGQTKRFGSSAYSDLCQPKIDI